MSDEDDTQALNNVVDLQEFKKRKSSESREHCASDPNYWHYIEPDPNNKDANEFLNSLKDIYRDFVPDLSDKECDKILFLSLKLAGEEGIEKEECESILTWANQVVVSYNAIALALKGHIGFKWDRENQDVIPVPTEDS